MRSTRSSSESRISGVASRISPMRPIEASPRSKMFTTQPSAIIGQCSIVRYAPNATNSPRLMVPPTTMRPPSQSTRAAPLPISSWMPGYRLPNIRISRRLRRTYSWLASAKRASSWGSCTYARTTRAPARFSCTSALSSESCACTSSKRSWMRRPK
jgi:hypothetical protein